jgi:hypothetical protein
MNERLLRRSIALSFPAASGRPVNAVGADSPERPDRFDPLNRPPAAGEYRTL